MGLEIYAILIDYSVACLRGPNMPPNLGHFAAFPGFSNKIRSFYVNQLH